MGGKKPVAMADLRALAADLGCSDVRSLLQSGNLVFRGNGAAARLERRLEQEAEARLGLSTTFFLRSAPEWRDIIAGNPLRAEAERDPGHLIVMCLRDAPDAARVKALQGAIVGREVVRAGGRHLYVTYPDGAGRSRLTTALIDRTLGTICTGRNWNTVRKLAACAGEVEPQHRPV